MNTISIHVMHYRNPAKENTGSHITEYIQKKPKKLHCLKFREVRLLLKYLGNVDFSAPVYLFRGMRSVGDSYDTDSCEMRNFRSRSCNNALTLYDVLIVCPELQGIGVSLRTNVGFDKCWDCLRKHYFNAGECRVEFQTQNTGRAARTSIRRSHGSSTAGQYVGRGGDYNLYRPKDAGGARPCRICQHHPP